MFMDVNEALVRLFELFTILLCDSLLCTCYTVNGHRGLGGVSVLEPDNRESCSGHPGECTWSPPRPPMACSRLLPSSWGPLSSDSSRCSPARPALGIFGFFVFADGVGVLSLRLESALSLSMSGLLCSGRADFLICYVSVLILHPLSIGKTCLLLTGIYVC